MQELTLADGIPEDDAEVRLKEFYINEATKNLNAATKVRPTHPPIYVARGVTCLLRASIQPPMKKMERMEMYKQAAKCFDDSLRATYGKNLMAKLGKARVNYAMGKYADALKMYQTVLESSPDLIDPDPRIGIGCCFWHLGFKDDAAGAWQRSLDLVSSLRLHAQMDD